jgi:hypothetical protein
MNSYALGITGNWIFPILLVIIAVAFSIYSYRHTVPLISKTNKSILITLRSIALALFLFVLFEPVFTRISGSLEPPRIAVFIDNSISTGETDAKFDRKKLVQQAIDNSGILKEASDFLNIRLFDADVYEVPNFKYDSLKFKGQTTDISKAIRQLIGKDNTKNYRAGILITDGAFNTGNNPLYDINVLDKPLFVIGIGDSTEPKDVSVSSVITNELGYIDNPIPVNVNLNASGYNSGEVSVKLLENGNQIAEQKVNINENQKTFSLVFEYRPKTEGIQKLTAKAEPIEGEITKKNNSYSEYINILKNKRKFAIFAGAPSSDVSFLYNVLNKEKGVEIKQYIQKKGSQYYDNEPSAQELKDVEMFFLIGFPVANSSDNSINLIKNELATGKPVFFMASQNISYQKLTMLDEFLPFKTLSSNTSEFFVVPDFIPQANSHPLLRIFGSDKDMELWNQLPTIFRTELYVSVKPESEKIAGFKINNTPVKEPLILSRVFQNKKSVAVLAYGLYRWKLIGYAEELTKGNQSAMDLYTLFIQNSLRWLSIDRENKNVTIKTTKKLYTNSEKVEFIAQVYDAAYSPIDNPKVEVKISGAGGKRDIILNSLGNGRYHCDVEGLAEGDYYFYGNVINNGQVIGNDKGRFSVGEIALEYQNLSMNAPLLREMAERSGGKFYLPDNCSSIVNDIKNHKGFKDRSITIKREYGLWNIAWLLAFAIALLAAEWFIRKRLGMV